jgi:hypothetical protein
VHRQPSIACDELARSDGVRKTGLLLDCAFANRETIPARRLTPVDERIGWQVSGRTAGRIRQRRDWNGRIHRRDGRAVIGVAAARHDNRGGESRYATENRNIRVMVHRNTPRELRLPR